MVEASRIVEHATVLNVHHDKCCWAHHGNQTSESRARGVVTASESLEVDGGADFIPKDARVSFFMTLSALLKSIWEWLTHAKHPALTMLSKTFVACAPSRFTRSPPCPQQNCGQFVRRCCC